MNDWSKVTTPLQKQLITEKAAEKELTEQHFRSNPSLCAGNTGSLGEGHPTQLELEQLLKPGLSLLVKRKNIPVMSSLGR